MLPISHYNCPDLAKSFNTNLLFSEHSFGQNMVTPTWKTDGKIFWKCPRKIQAIPQCWASIQAWKPHYSTGKFLKIAGSKIQVVLQKYFLDVNKGKIIYKAIEVSCLISLHFPSNLHFSFRGTLLRHCVYVAEVRYVSMRLATVIFIRYINRIR